MAQDVGDYLRAFRSEHDLTKAELAARLRSKLRTIEDWEAGRRSPPGMLPLALSSVSLGINPWAPTRRLTSETPMAEVKAMANWLFSSEGQSRAIDMEDEFSRCVPATARPSEALLFAHLLNACDGYHNVSAYEDWAKRPSKGIELPMSFRPEFPGACPTIGIETRWDGETRLLAIFVDSQRPGERSPDKLRLETSLVTRGIRVISFSEAEIFVDPENCKERVESILTDLTDDCLVTLGHISPRRRKED